jgi:hypothetical protein
MNFFRDIVSVFSVQYDLSSKKKERYEILFQENVPCLKLLRNDLSRGVGASGGIIHSNKKSVVFIFPSTQTIQKDWIILEGSTKYIVSQVELTRGVSFSQKRVICEITS